MISLGLMMIAFGIATKIVTARFCEGGHRCLPPKECCVQGCCYLYAPPSSPRSSSPPPTDHVLNLFFINHWYFWCLVLAFILALLCACSLWRKRRQLCGGWTGSSSSGHAHSEGDSAGSCYAPPQYSRCNSFHLNFHAPPPYTEVTSKPDLYPLVFTYTGNNDGNGKSGTNYLMVQYFRNYIVRPAISSSSSLFDSISSENHVPPPYSRATSPDSSGGAIIRNTNETTNTYIFPRSISQNNNIITMNDSNGLSNSINHSHSHNNSNNNNSNNSHNNNNNSNNNNSSDEIKNYNSRSNSVPNTTTTTTILATNHNNNNSINYSINHSNSSGGHHHNHQHQQQQQHHQNQNQQHHHSSHSSHNGHHANSNHFMIADLHSAFIPISNSSGGNSNNNTNISGNKNNLYNSCNSIISNISTATYSLAFHNAANDNNNEIQKCTLEIEQNSIGGSRASSRNASAGTGSLGNGGSGGSGSGGDANHEELNVLRRSLETCCQLLQQQHQQRHISNKNNQQQGSNLYNSSTVSSLANLGSPGSQPQVGTSPTLEVKELLEQIRQFQMHSNSSTIDIIAAANGTTVKLSSPDLSQPTPPKRPSTLQHSKAKSSSSGYSKSKRGIYLPLSIGGSCTGGGGGSGASSCGSTSNSINFDHVKFAKSHRNSRTNWISKSAPTTPGQPPNNLICDKSPLLVEHEHEEEDEDEVDENDNINLNDDDDVELS